MKKENVENNFEAYEDARVEKKSTEAAEVSDSSVEAAIDIINPDENTEDRG